MQGRILYICRQNNDFERFVAIADAVNKSHTQWLFHTQALERVKNRHLAGILWFKSIGKDLQIQTDLEDGSVVP